jgi:hypothetical protein
MQTQQTKKTVFSIVCAVAFGLLAIRSIVYVFKDFAYLDSITYFPYDFFSALGFAALGFAALVLGFDKIDKKLSFVGFCGACCLAIGQLLYLGILGRLGAYVLINYNGYAQYGNLFLAFPNVLKLIAYALLAVELAVGTFGVFEKSRAGFRHLWFVAPAFLLLAAVLQQLLYMAYGLRWYGGYSMFTFSHFTLFIVLLVAMVAIGILALNPKALENSVAPAYAPDGQPQGGDGTGYSYSAGSEQYSRPPQKPNGYFDMVPHILLLLFTFGIWRLIWVYRTTEFLNCTPNEPERTPVCQLLLFMFVPFYSFYWIYASCKRIDALGYYKDIPGEITVMCVICEIFINILTPMFMQDKINNIVMR